MPDLISVDKSSPSVRFVLGGDLLRQDVAGNYSVVRFYLRAINIGNTSSYFNNWGQQQGHVEGLVHFGTHSGQPFLPSGVSNGTWRWNDAFDVAIGHGADGTRGPVTVRMYLGYGNVNESHYATFDNFPRIPKAPGAPVSVRIDEVTSSSFRYTFSGTHDGGGGISGWEAQRATDAAFTQNVVTVGSTGTTTFSGLTPNMTYWARARGSNPYGTSGWSDALSVKIGLPAPTLTGWSQNGNGELVATWSPPSATNGLTGYRLQIARDAGFTQSVAFVDVGNVTSRAISGLSGGRRYWVRVAALTSGGVNAWSNAADTLLILDSGDLDGWTRFGSKPANISYFTSSGIRRGAVGTAQALFVESLATGAATLTADAFGIQKTFTGLQVGKAYRFAASGTLADSSAANHYSIQVVGEIAGPGTDLTASGTPFAPLEFVAHSTSATVQIRLAQTLTIGGARDVVEAVAFHGIRLLELNTDYPQRLRNTVYESSLANHFDLACNSVGATWYVDKNGNTRFNLPGTALPVSAIFSDTPMPGAVSYVDINGGFDTRTTVNRIEATNYGVGADGNEENDELVVEDPTSQATYGVYRSTLALNLHDEAPYTDAFSARLGTLLAEHKTPEAQVSSLRWNAQEDLALAASLEVGQRLNVRYRGVSYDVQIVSIAHDIQPTRWMITLQLQQL